MTLTKAQQDILIKYEVSTLCEFLNVFPTRYEIFELSDEQSLVDGQHVILEGHIASLMKSTFYAKNKSVTHFQFVSHNGYKVSIFNRHYLKAPSDPLRKVVIVGKYKYPNQIIASNIYYQTLEQLGQIQAIYPIKEKTQLKQIKALISKALAVCHQYTIDLLPKDIIEEYQLVPQSLAMKEIHQPTTMALLSQSIHRFKVSEFLEYHLQIQNNRLKVVHTKPNRSLSRNLIEPLIQSLPYDLTQDQVDALTHLFEHANQPVTLSALLQGDVGSGKTIVAMLLAYAYIKSGFSVAFMVPTEVLAMQHYLNAMALFEQLHVEVHLLTSSTKVSDRKSMLEKVHSNPSLLIGTHALYSNDVQFSQLGLVIIDEQHRFGVAQRMKLIQKGTDVDVLSMSATPIPRTLAAVLFADMQVITLNHKPKERGDVKTHIIAGNSFSTVLDDILESIARKEQVYVITSMIEEEGEARSALSIYTNLRKAFDKKFGIGLLHGKMKTDDKQNVLNAFYRNEIQMLVSTSVVEVGVDVPNATRMIIYDAHRFGLSSLHQLRGRIGRSIKPSICYLINPSDDPLSIERLSVLVQSHDGFKIASEDLRLRGPGDLIGLKQSGLPSFQFANIILDYTLLEQTKKSALKLLHSSDSEHQKFVSEVIQRSLKGID
jgi:ATP-dependent DNA helicase RecG